MPGGCEQEDYDAENSKGVFLNIYMNDRMHDVSRYMLYFLKYFFIPFVHYFFCTIYDGFYDITLWLLSPARLWRSWSS